MFSAESEGETLPIDPLSLWPGLAASLGFRREDGVRGIVVVGEVSGTPRGWPSSEQSMVLGIFLLILYGHVISRGCCAAAVGERER